MLSQEVPSVDARSRVSQQGLRSIYQLRRNDPEVPTNLQEEHRCLVDGAEERQIEGEELRLCGTRLRKLGLEDDSHSIEQDVNVGASPAKTVLVCEHYPLLRTDLSAKVQALQIALDLPLVSVSGFYTGSLPSLCSIGEGTLLYKFRPFQATDPPDFPRLTL